MTSLTASFWDILRPASAERQAERTRPAPPASGPVFIHDCISPVNHSTLLLVKWREWDEARTRQDGP